MYNYVDIGVFIDQKSAQQSEYQQSLYSQITRSKHVLGAKPLRAKMGLEQKHPDSYMGTSFFVS